MYILNQKESTIIDSNFFGMYAITKDSPGYLVGAYLSKESGAIRLGWYIEKDEAEAALYELFVALQSGEDAFCMPQRQIELRDEAKSLPD